MRTCVLASMTMRIPVWFICLAVLWSGCANRRPLVSLPDTRATLLHVESQGQTKEKVESARGHNARQNATNGGVLGVLAAETVAASTQDGSGAVLHALRQQTRCPEQALLEQAVKAQLRDAGVSWSEQPAPHTLTLRLGWIELEEQQRGFWHVRTLVTATVRDAAHKDLWTVHVLASSPTLRTLKTFADQPNWYTEDFREAAQDAARQLVVGPIR